jgi:phosphoglycerate dehydrogenase-like enzyme
MTRPVVYVTQEIHPDALAVLEDAAEVIVGYGPGAVPVDQVIDRIEGLMLRFSGIAADVVERAPLLRVIARAGSGYESVPVEAARRRGIPVWIPAGANARSVAEHVIALALAAARQVPYWDGMARSGDPDLLQLREGALGMELTGKRLGLIGAGRVGEEVARIARDGFGMTVSAYHPRRTPEQLRALGMEPAATVEELLADADVVSVQVPLTDETRGMLGAAQFRVMKPRSILVDVARGGVIDESALAASMADGRPGAAGIDVWADKVPHADNPLLHTPGVVASPHRAGRTEEAQVRAGVLAAHALIDALAGRSPHDVEDVAGP